ncbi:MAG: glycosyltransferase family 4 protein [Elusimicrobiota bacterium]|jgi:glycosyltransferase involved in cell wall biosynthesis
MPDTRPRVLMLTPGPPYPWDGGSKRIHSLCRLLADRFRFSLLTFRPPAQDITQAALDLQKQALYLDPVFEAIHWVEPEEPAPARIDGIWIPPDARRFYCLRMEERLAALAGTADILHVEFELMAIYGRRARELGRPCILTQHDTGSLSLFNSYMREMAGWGKFARIPEWLKRRVFARRSADWFDRIVVMSEADQNHLAGIIRRGHIQVIPTGVDLEHFHPDAGVPPASPPRLVYVGHYPHFPNEDAVLHFLRRIWPRIRAQSPHVEFHIVGSAPTPAVRRAAQGLSGVSITDTVPDVRPQLAAAAIFVAPLRLGCGIKGKILEAFAMGLPVVTTRLAAAGLQAVPGRDLVVADSDADFAASVLQLLNSPQARARLGSRGREVARAAYDWRRLAGRLGDLYAGLANTSSKSDKNAA